MPRVETDRIARVESTSFSGRQNIQATPEDFGFGIGAEVERIGFEMQQEDDETRANDALTQYNQGMRDLMHNPETGYLNQKGENAYRNFSTTNEQIESLRQQLADDLDNDRQRDLFLRTSQKQTDSYLDSASRHASSERQVWLKATQEASVEDTIEDAAANYTQPDIVRNNMIKGEMTLQEMASDEGWSKEVLNERLDDYRSNAHISVMNRMVANNDYESAQAWFSNNKDAIDGTKHAEIESRLNDGVINNQARRNVEAIYDSNTPINTLTKEARDSTDNTQLADEMVRRLKIMRDEDLEAEKAIQNESYELGGFIIIDQGGSTDDIPRSAWENMTTQQKVSLKTLESKSENRTTDIATWNAINQMAIEDPKQFSELPLLNFASNLSLSDFQEFGKLQRKYKDQDQQTISSVQSLGTKANNALKAVNIDIDEDRGQKFMRAFQQQVSRFEQATGERIQPNEVDKIIDTLLIEGEIEGRFVDPDKRFFEVEAGEVFFIEDIPESELKLIDAALDKAGKPKTNENRVLLYTADQIAPVRE